ncbi:MAG: tryptophan synthase subunit alpha [Phycisphaerae bacterium]
MGAERIERRFAENRERDRCGGLLPYFTAGFPDSAAFGEFIRAADGLGVIAVEVGMPYSDSIADGPIIQGSFNEALSRGHNVEATFDAVAGVRASVDCGLLAMVSYSIVRRIGVDAFVDRAAATGFDGLIVPDLPLEESAPLAHAARRAELCHVGLVAPTTCPERRRTISRQSTGFIYRIAVAGTTGERDSLPAGLEADVAQLRNDSSLPVCVGFGVSTVEQVRAVCAFADGAVVGSAVIRRIDDELKKGSARRMVIASVARLLRELMSGTGGGSGGDA